MTRVERTPYGRPARSTANDVAADLDDAANVENNETELQVEVYDYNDRI